MNPDLYGPFWVTLTLIFTIGISGNLARFFQHDHTSDFIWHYNFHLVSYASTCLIMYVCIMPLAIWSVLKWSINEINEDIDLDIESVRENFLLISVLHLLISRPRQAPYVPSLLSIVCLYGYSLSVYVPVAVLWTEFC